MNTMFNNSIKKLIIICLSVATILGTVSVPASAMAKDGNGNSKNKVNHGQIISAEKKLAKSINKIGNGNKNDQEDNAIKPENILFRDNSAINSARQTFVQASNNANSTYRSAINTAHSVLASALSSASSDLNARLSAYRTYISSLLAAFQQKAAAKESALQQFIASLTNVTFNKTLAANQQSVTVTENIPKAITLTGTDPQNLSLTYIISTNPSHGTLSGSVPNLTYTPNTNYIGSDSFTFKVNDGTLDSNVATISISVAADQAPTANNQSVTVSENTSKAITLTGSDPEGSTLTYAVVTSTNNGTLSGTAPNLTYLPSTNYTGSDSFTFKVNDGTLDSALASILITVSPTI